VLVGGVLLVAAFLKAQRLFTDLSASPAVLQSRWFQALLVAAEAACGLALWLRVRPRLMRWVAMLMFAGFLGVTLSQALGGAQSCACFGRIAVSPWKAMILDAAVAVLLVLWRPAEVRHRLPFAPRLLFISAIMPFVFRLDWLTGGVIAPLVGVPATAQLMPDGEIRGSGERITLDPESWIGRRFPLLKHIDVESQMSYGRWIAVLYRRNCSACAVEVPKYEKLARAPAQLTGAWRVAFIEIPNDREPLPDLVAPDSPCLRGQLTGLKEWVVKTPMAFGVEDGFVRWVADSPDGYPAERALFPIDPPSAQGS
jgi:hypothetical protein